MMKLFLSFGWRLALMVGLSAFQAWALEPAGPVLGGKGLESKLIRDVSGVAAAGPVTSSYAEVIEGCLSSVVSISTYSGKAGRRFGFELEPDDWGHLPPHFREFFGDWLERRDGRGPRTGEDRVAPRKPVRTGLGSGVILTGDGYILTNRHVVERAEELRIGIAGRERPYVARVIGMDAQTDIALVKIEATGLTPATIGDSGKLRVGDVVLAVGSPMGLEQSVTQGIVSGLGRTDLGIIEQAEPGPAGYENFIQTDAAINPGNSGGPLLDAHGRVVGLNTAIETRSGMFAGIGLAIPISMAVRVVCQLADEGKVRRGFLGIEMDRIDPGLADLLELRGAAAVVVSGVVKGSAAERAGLEEGDALVDLDGQSVVGPAPLRLAISERRPGAEVRLGVVRFDHALGRPERLELRATLQALPEPGGGVDEDSPVQESRPRSGSGVLPGAELEALSGGNRDLYGMGAEAEGVVVTAVEADSAAQRGGLEVGDVIVQVNRRPVSDVDGVRAAVGASAGVVVVKVVRAGRPRFLVIPPAAR